MITPIAARALDPVGEAGLGHQFPGGMEHASDAKAGPEQFAVC